MQVRFCLKVVLKSWDERIVGMAISFHEILKVLYSIVSAVCQMKLTVDAKTTPEADGQCSTKACKHESSRLMRNNKHGGDLSTQYRAFCKDVAHHFKYHII